MALRSFTETHNKFPVELMLTFILNWNSFAVEQIGVHPLPLDPKLGLSIVMTPMVFKQNISCNCVVYRKKDVKGNEAVTLRMNPISKVFSPHVAQKQTQRMPLRLLRNSPGSYAVAAARSLVPPPIAMPAAAHSPTPVASPEPEQIIAAAAAAH